MCSQQQAKSSRGTGTGVVIEKGKKVRIAGGGLGGWGGARYIPLRFWRKKHGNCHHSGYVAQKRRSGVTLSPQSSGQ